MTVAALLDLGGDRQALEEGLESLGVDGYQLSFGRVKKSGIDAFDFTVQLEEEHSHHHSHHDEHTHEHPHSDDTHHDHSHEHPHPHHHEEHPHEESSHPHDHSHSHAHRGFEEIRSLIEGSAITPGAKELAIRIFRVVAEAEATVHGIPVEEVHFHEVGAVDSIVDIVGAAILLDNLQAERVICSPLSEGQGRVHCQHGWMPVPAPATLEIARQYNIPLTFTQNQGEMVTPTGAAIVAAIADDFGVPDGFVVQKVGYGAGKKEFPHTANLLRILELASGEASPRESVCEISCNLDDISSENLSFACEELLAAGALDVWVTPILMKKGRPGHLLSLLCLPEEEEAFSLLLIRHTSTIGVRSCLKARWVMNRRSFAVETPYGPVMVKESALDGIHRIKVEFESAKQTARERGVSIQQVISAAHSALARQYERPEEVK